MVESLAWLPVLRAFFRSLFLVLLFVRYFPIPVFSFNQNVLQICERCSMRHSYRSWLDAVGTPVALQQKLMRHADIRTTINMYGDVITDGMAQAAK